MPPHPAPYGCRRGATFATVRPAELDRLIVFKEPPLACLANTNSKKHHSEDGGDDKTYEDSRQDDDATQYVVPKPASSSRRGVGLRGIGFHGQGDRHGRAAS